MAMSCHANAVSLLAMMMMKTMIMSRPVPGECALLRSLGSRHQRRHRTSCMPSSPRLFAKTSPGREDDEQDDFLTMQVDDLVNQLLEGKEDDDDTSSASTFSISKVSENHERWIHLTNVDVQNIDDLFNDLSPPTTTTTLKNSSPVEEHFIRGQRIWWKRDDLLKLPGSLVSGNKARKMWTLNQWAVITDPDHSNKNNKINNNADKYQSQQDSADKVEDTHHDLLKIPPFPDCIVSYGGPQSNAMVALAAIVNYKNRQFGISPDESIEGDDDNDDDKDNENDNTELAVRHSDADQSHPYKFIYYTKTLPRFLRNQPSGNLFRARTLGMELVEIPNDEYNRIFSHAEDGTNRAAEHVEAPKNCKSLFVPQGGAFPAAREGATRLAFEIYEFWSNCENSHLPLSVCIPGGTCSTALLVHHGLKAFSADGVDIEVVVIPCVANELYSRRQMMSLNTQLGIDPSDIPTILRPSPVQNDLAPNQSSRYYTFGKPHKEILNTYSELRDGYDLNVDLLYGAPSWTILWRHWDTIGPGKNLVSPDLGFDPYLPLAGREIMYVHSGGLEGVSSQMLRYKYDGLIKVSDVQLPGRNPKGKKDEK